MAGPTTLEVVEGIDLTGKTCVITGAPAGLGRESARALAATGAHVILAARNVEALRDAEAWIRAEVPDAPTSTVELDLTSLASVRTAAAAIQDLAPEIHVLMNNAGVMFTPFGRTTDGFEIQFGTNHLGHFELTRLLTRDLSRVPASSFCRRTDTGCATSTWPTPTGSEGNTTSSLPTDHRRPPMSCTWSSWTAGCVTAGCGPAPCTRASSRRPWHAT